MTRTRRTFRLWAPAASSVELIFNDDRLPMREEAGGWWRCDAEARAGDRYAFSLDNGPPRPDPRSAFQPDGVHDPSALVDHDAYVWRCPTFRAPPLSSAIIYELHVGTFTPEGTLDAAIDRLDHLASLGVTHVELMPLNAFDGEHGWGYDGVLWYAPHRAYTGPDGPDAVKRFVDACHERDLAVVLDVVYNHLGPSGNYLAEFGPYFTDAYHTPWGAALNLDQDHARHVRRYICDNALMWLCDYRFDALRLDAIHAFHDESATHLLEQLASEVRELEADTGRPLTLIAESDLNDPRVVTSVEARGLGLDAQWSDDFHHALHSVATGERDGYYSAFGSIAQLGKALSNAFVYDGVMHPTRQRLRGRSTSGLTTDRFLAYIQNHDQIGNRATGDRIARSLNEQQLKTCAALVLLAPFVPMLFQGEEWGASAPFQYFADHQDPGLADAVRTGRRSEFSDFGWNPEDVPDPIDLETFHRSKLDWDETKSPEHDELLRWHHALIALRTRLPGVAARPLEALRVTHSEDERWLAFRNGPIGVAASFATPNRSSPGAASHRIPLAGLLDENEHESCALTMASHPECRFSADAAHVTPGGCLVFVCEHATAG